jgi:hypothetical protein
MALLAESGDDLPQIPAASEFPNALAAMESVEPSLQKAESQAQWSVGDAVLEDIPIQRVGVRDGSLERLAALAKSRGLREIYDRLPPQAQVGRFEVSRCPAPDILFVDDP